MVTMLFWPLKTHCVASRSSLWPLRHSLNSYVKITENQAITNLWTDAPDCASNQRTKAAQLSVYPVTYAADLTRFLPFRMTFCRSLGVGLSPLARPGDLPRRLGNAGFGSMVPIIRKKSRCTMDGEASLV